MEASSGDTAAYQFTPSGKRAQTLAEFIAVCTEEPAIATEHLYCGYFERWLTDCLNLPELSCVAMSVVRSHANRSEGLAEFLRAAVATRNRLQFWPNVKRTSIVLSLGFIAPLLFLTGFGLPKLRQGQDLPTVVLSAGSEQGTQVLSLIALVLYFGGLALWKLPQLQLASSKASLERKDFLTIENQYRTTLAQIVGGMVVIIGLAFTWQQIATSQRTLDTTQQGQITDRFSRAIEQLGSERPDGCPRIEIRLGGIYALERIARDSDRDRSVVLGILTAYIRENAPWREGDSAKLLATAHCPNVTADPAGGSGPIPSADIRAIVSVLARNTWWAPPSAPVPDTDRPNWNLDRTDLRGLVLPSDSILPRMSFVGAHLEMATILGRQVQLARTNFNGAYLNGAYLQYADLTGAQLQDAHLEGAYLQCAGFAGANFTRAHLEGTHLQGATYSEAINLTSEQLASAFTGATVC